jgi:hypothetical protein
LKQPQPFKRGGFLGGLGKISGFTGTSTGKKTAGAFMFSLCSSGMLSVYPPGYKQGIGIYLQFSKNDRILGILTTDSADEQGQNEDFKAGAGVFPRNLWFHWSVVKFLQIIVILQFL